MGGAWGRLCSASGRTGANTKPGSGVARARTPGTPDRAMRRAGSSWPAGAGGSAGRHAAPASARPCLGSARAPGPGAACVPAPRRPPPAPGFRGSALSGHARQRLRAPYLRDGNKGEYGLGFVGCSMRTRVSALSTCTGVAGAVRWPALQQQLRHCPGPAAPGHQVSIQVQHSCRESRCKSGVQGRSRAG